MRPDIKHLFDHTIRVWRPIVNKDDVGVEERDYEVVAVYGAKLNRSTTSDVPQAGGLAEVGTLRWYGEPTIDVAPRYICDVLTGPDSGHQWEVKSLPVRPRGHHTQVDCIEWHGTLPVEP